MVKGVLSVTLLVTGLVGLLLIWAWYNSLRHNFWGLCFGSTLSGPNVYLETVGDLPSIIFGRISMLLVPLTQFLSFSNLIEYSRRFSSSYGTLHFRNYNPSLLDQEATELPCLDLPLKNSLRGKSDMEERFKKLRDAPECPQYSSKPKIQKVPYMLGDPKNFEKYYEPRAVAIGPFHHGKTRCEVAQGFKLMLTSKFIKYAGQKDEDLYKKIEEKIKELRDCYVEEATKCYDNETLAWMLFLDGCSTLQFIYSFMHEELEKVFKIKRDQIAFAQQDLFLLENQVPYQVLELLMSSSNKHEELKQSIDSFVRMHIFSPAQKQSKDQEQKQQEGVATNMNQNQQASVTANTNQKQQPGVAKMEQTIDMEKEPVHLLDLLRTRMLGPPKPDVHDKGVHDKGVNDFTWQSFRNVQELNAAGIHFKPSRSPSFLKDISFVSHCFAGFLSLPPISVDDSTGPKFMNLIAYEMCPDFLNDFGVTSYIGFLDALIDNADDVKKLRSSGVLNNLLGSDKEVAHLFNEIGTDLVPNNDIYYRVIADIEKHYRTKWKTWMSQFCHDHFSSPWTFLAFMGVLAALGLSGIQTWYTVNSPPSACDVVCQYLKTRLHLK